MPWLSFHRCKKSGWEVKTGFKGVSYFFVWIFWKLYHFHCIVWKLNSHALFYLFFGPVLRIRGVYTGSRIRIFPFQIPDPNPHQRILVFGIWDFHPGSRIWISSISDPDPGCSGLQAPDLGSGSATLHLTMFTVGIVSISGPECVRNLLC